MLKFLREDLFLLLLGLLLSQLGFLNLTERGSFRIDFLERRVDDLGLDTRLARRREGGIAASTLLEAFRDSFMVVIFSVKDVSQFVSVTELLEDLGLPLSAKASILELAPKADVEYLVRLFLPMNFKALLARLCMPHGLPEVHCDLINAREIIANGFSAALLFF